MNFFSRLFLSPPKKLDFRNLHFKQAAANKRSCFSLLTLSENNVLFWHFAKTYCRKARKYEQALK